MMNKSSFSFFLFGNDWYIEQHLHKQCIILAKFIIMGVGHVPACQKILTLSSRLDLIWSNRSAVVAHWTTDQQVE